MNFPPHNVSQPAAFSLPFGPSARRHGDEVGTAALKLGSKRWAGPFTLLLGTSQAKAIRPGCLLWATEFMRIEWRGRAFMRWTVVTGHDASMHQHVLFHAVPFHRLFTALHPPGVFRPSALAIRRRRGLTTGSMRSATSRPPAPARTSARSRERPPGRRSAKSNEAAPKGGLRA